MHTGERPYKCKLCDYACAQVTYSDFSIFFMFISEFKAYTAHENTWNFSGASAQM